MSFVSYAQNFEDIRLWRAFSDVKEGRYLDIGAQDPVRDSVSLLFYERGWRGIHVEPTPDYAAAIRAARPDETVIQAAVSPRPGPIQFFEIPETGISTGVAWIADNHAKAGWEHRIITVPTVTLASLFEMMGEAPIHWMKIDVEGMEADVLESWGEHPARPAALVIEATLPNTQNPTHSAWHDMVTSRGYQFVAFDGLSRYYIHEAHAARGDALAVSANVFDGFQVAATHFVAGRVAAEKDDAIQATKQQAEAERLEAIASVQAQAEAEMLAARAELGARIETGENALTEARQALLAQQQEHLALAGEVGRLQGELTTQIEASAARLRDAAALRRSLAKRLAKREQELVSAKTQSTDLQSQIHILKGNHALAIAQADSALTTAKASAVQLEKQLADVARRLEESEAERAQTEQMYHAARQQGEERAAALTAELGQLRAHIDRCEGQLTQAMRLLGNAPDPLAGWPRGVANFLARLVGRRPAASVAAHAAQLAALQAEVAMALGTTSDEAWAQAGTGTGGLSLDFERVLKELDMSEREGPITSVPQLLARHDADFVRTAYQALLGRAPDEEGHAYYLQRLRAGVHKLDLLKQLRRSPEGRNFIPGVAGLDRAIKRHRMANLPLVGAIIRLLTGAEGNSAVDRQIRAMRNELDALKSQHSAIHYSVPTSQILEELSSPQPDDTNTKRVFTIDRAASYDADDFMHAYDMDFVNQLYCCILKREPDPRGFQHYLNRVRQGISRIQILHEVRYSKEGGSVGVNINGLAAPHIVNKISNFPIIGGLLHYTFFCINIKNHMRDLRNIENQVHRLSNYFNSLKN